MGAWTTAGIGVMGLWPCLVGAAPEVTVVGDWSVQVGAGEVVVAGRAVAVTPTTLEVQPADQVVVTDERALKLPLYDPAGPVWRRAYPLRGVVTQETTARHMLDPDSLRVKAGPGADAVIYQRGVDYEAELEWGQVGRLEGGGIAEDQPVYLDYRYGRCRIDSVIVDAQGRVSLRRGEPHVNVPKPPPVEAEEAVLANVWVPGRLRRLGPANVFPILETAYPEPPLERPTPAERLLPKTLAKLRAGEPLRILAWGDSVTHGGFVGDLRLRWQDQFVARLAERWPQAQIELLHLGWGGRNTASFLAEPPGSEWNYQERVLGQRPDLIVSEFVNDAGLTGPQLEERYGKFLADFQDIGAEWIILTPHYVRPDWMGLSSERDCDEDPRPYVRGLREFAARHGVALADASLRWGRLWRQGIPYTTLLLNAINHPDGRGMKLFADALMALFPPE